VLKHLNERATVLRHQRDEEGVRQLRQTMADISRREQQISQQQTRISTAKQLV
jgi:hypothetical protein